MVPLQIDLAIGAGRYLLVGSANPTAPVEVVASSLTDPWVAGATEDVFLRRTTPLLPASFGARADGWATADAAHAAAVPGGVDASGGLMDARSCLVVVRLAWIHPELHP
jgi:hypothetical protein